MQQCKNDIVPNNTQHCTLYLFVKNTGKAEWLYEYMTHMTYSSLGVIGVMRLEQIPRQSGCFLSIIHLTAFQ